MSDLNSFGNSEFFSQINSMNESEITQSSGYLKHKNRAKVSQIVLVNIWL